MREWLLILFLAAPAFGQDVAVAVRPDAVYVETIGGDIAPMERTFFHVLLENKAAAPVQVEWVRLDLTNPKGILLSVQYSGEALTNLFDSSIDRKRIEPTAKQTLQIQPGERKAISDLFMDLPQGFIGNDLLVEVSYASAGQSRTDKASVQLRRTEGFVGRLPFNGVWYVAAEHSYLDPHKRFAAEAFAYDFLQVGANGKSYKSAGDNNADYYAYGQQVLAAKDGTVVAVRRDMAENVPGQTNVESPAGNVVIIDHGNGQFGYYAHLKPFTVNVKPGAKVKAGDPLGQVGNSGDSPAPHLHFHVMNGPDPMQADGIPIVFESWKAQSYSRFPAARQLETLPRGEFVQP